MSAHTKEELGHLVFGAWAPKRCIELSGEAARASIQTRVPKFIRMGLSVYDHPSKGSNKSAVFDIY
tara:strand:- start:172 stop:369 length:198 start_codon:yes stop_codon:yes gene_type:complete